MRLFLALAQPARFGAPGGEQLGLVGFEVTPGPGPDDHTYVNLYWQTAGSVGCDYTVFVHAVDAQGRTLAQDDVQLKNRGGAPTSAWQPGDAARSFHTLPALSAGATLRVGLYDLRTMRRLPLQGDASDENAVTVAQELVDK